MIMLALIVNVTFVFLAMWLIATMGDSNIPKDGDLNDTMHRLMDQGGPVERTNEETDTLEKPLHMR